MNDASTNDTPNSTTNSEAIIGNNGSLYSVFVPTALANGNGAGTGGYFRIGAADDNEEWQLPEQLADDGSAKAPTKPEGTPKSPFKAGILLYSTGPYQCVAEKVHFATRALTATLFNGKELAMAQSHEAAGVNTTYQVVDALTASMGNISSSMVGSQLTHTAVNNATLSTLGRLVSNLGATANVFGGTVVSVNGCGVAVQGYGQYSNVKAHRVCAVESIQFMTDAFSTTGAMDIADAWATKLAYATGVLNTVLTGSTIIFAGVMQDPNNVTDTGEVQLKLSGLHYFFDATSLLVMLAQIGIILVGAFLQKTKYPEDVKLIPAAPQPIPAPPPRLKPLIEITNDAITLQVGTTSISLGPDSINFDTKTFEAKASTVLKLGNALLKNKIVIDGAGVAIEVGTDTSLKLSAASAVMAAKKSSVTTDNAGITLGAKETKHVIFKPIGPNAPEPLSIPITKQF